MSTISYESFIPEEEKDILKIESRPQIISYQNLYNIRDCEKVPKLFLVVPNNSKESFNKSVIYVIKKSVPEFRDDEEKDIFIFNFSEGISNTIICA